MNVYDFDKTIYDGDCTVDFVFYCFKNYPKTRHRIPSILLNGFLFSIKLQEKIKFKKRLYTFLQDLEDIDCILEDFTKSHLKKIKPWYLSQQQDTDLIISASPEFLIHLFCKKLTIHHWMASPVDKFTGKYLGENCFGIEKVRRFDEVYHRDDIDNFYSDSYSDDPLAQLAKEAYLVKGNQLSPWKK